MTLIGYSQRIAAAVLLAVFGAALIFFTMHAAPGDPALAALGEGATPQAIAAFRLRWHLDEPLIIQFIWWLSSALQGQFGTSLTVASGMPVTSLILARLPNTVFIGVYALILAVLISVAAGTIAALKRGRNADVVATSAAIFGISMPDFWLSYVLIYAFALGTGWFPAYGFVQPQSAITGAIWSGTLPALAIAAPMAASFTRILRASLIEELHKDHVRVARSFGYGRLFVFAHFVFRNALIPYITVIGLQIRYLFGGTVIIERIFGIPGVGSLMVDGGFARDFPVVQACALTFLLCVLVVNMSVDAVCTALNPRRRW
ncbi:MAG: ABC transporter permease [Bradyrhizobium sp.]|uniref:ABC transporter permease n=1 Tax=Bradyrhizobium sp. TaxID=376 RepID=UPI001D1DD9EC|nr:ABC transporter permease [Bradyrhizobium sp.]MBV9563357.1 ABC transporter permease [Bradyrhizobium sp.]